MQEVKLNPKQTQVYESESFETVYTSGVGGGKTFILAMLIYRAIKTSKENATLTLLVAPTHEVMKTATWKGVTDAFEKIGFQYGIHYVVNERPPAYWNVPVYSRLNSAKVITWRSGSYTIVGSLEKFNSVRGAEYDEIYVDEFRDIKWEESRNVLTGRARGKSYLKQGKQHKIYYVSTPPDNVKELKKVVEDPNIKWVHGTSYDNRQNLPTNYIDQMKRVYDTVTFDREVLGKLVDSSLSNVFAYAFEEDFHAIPFEDYEIKVDENEPLRISFDFNVNPITAIVGQSDQDQIRIFRAFAEPNSDTEKLCDKIIAYYPLGKYIFQVTGDASGFSRDTRSKLNDFEIIKDKFELTPYQVLAPKKNSSIRDSQILCNSILANMDIRFCSKYCKELIEDLKYVTMVENSHKPEIDKKKHGAHSLDNFRYYIQTWHSNFLKFRK